jgi:hypothetical protein
MIASSHLSELEQQLAPHRQALLEHPVYQRIDRIDALHCFMEHHVCAVWDFMSLLKALQGAVEFRYYLERHIGLDGDEHGPLARRLVADLCGDDADRWQRATDAAVHSLVARRALWDGIAAAIGE